MASTNDRANRDRNALELRRAGVSVARIVDRLKFTTAQQAERAIERAMKATGSPTDPANFARWNSTASTACSRPCGRRRSAGTSRRSTRPRNSQRRRVASQASRPAATPS